MTPQDEKDHSIIFYNFNSKLFLLLFMRSLFFAHRWHSQGLSYGRALGLLTSRLKSPSGMKLQLASLAPVENL